MLPKTSASSVIPFVSTNINPAPRKKHVGEKFFLFIGFVFCMKKNEETKIKKIINMYDLGQTFDGI